MSQLRTRIQNQAYDIVRSQLIGLIILTIFCLGLSVKAAFSFLLGGLSGVIPNFILVAIAFRRVSAREMPQFVMRFAFGELFKLSASAFLLLMVVKYLPISLSSTLAGFIGVIILFWIACMRHFSYRQTTTVGAVSSGAANEPLRRLT